MKKIFVLLLICIVADAQEYIGKFSVTGNTTNGVPTISSTTKFILETDKIIIYDGKKVSFPIVNFHATNKNTRLTFSFNNANCVLDIHRDYTYSLSINSKNKVETFSGEIEAIDNNYYTYENNPTSNESILDQLAREAQGKSSTVADTFKKDIKTSEQYTQDELFLMAESKLKPIENNETNYADRTNHTDYTEEERKFLDLGYTFPPGTDLAIMRANEQAKSDKYVTYAAFTIIALGLIVGLIFIIRNKNQSLTKKDSNIKSINEEVLKNNLIANNLENANVTEIDNDTLKQKLGL